jgi:hypothetical protein
MKTRRREPAGRSGLRAEIRARPNERHDRRLGGLWGVLLQERNDQLPHTLQHCQSVVAAIRQLPGEDQGVAPVPIFDFHHTILSMRDSINGKPGERGARLGAIGRDHLSEFGH